MRQRSKEGDRLIILERISKRFNRSLYLRINLGWDESYILKRLAELLAQDLVVVVYRDTSAGHARVYALTESGKAALNRGVLTSA